MGAYTEKVNFELEVSKTSVLDLEVSKIMSNNLEVINTSVNFLTLTLTTTTPLSISTISTETLYIQDIIMACEIHLDDVGTMVQATMKECTIDPITGKDVLAILDISTATVLEILFKKPDKTSVTKPAVLSTDGTDGNMHYISETGFFDQLKKWEIQARVTFPGGKWSSTIGTFTVIENVD